MGWDFVWLMVIMKIPLALLLWIVWWAIRQTPEAAGEDTAGGGGGRAPRPRPPRPPRRPRRPRRGPHAGPAPSAPPRVRTGRRRVARPRERSVA